MSAKPDLPPDRINLGRIGLSRVSPKSLERRFSKRGNPVHHIPVARLTLFRRLLSALLNPLEEMPQRTVRHKERAKLDDGVFGSCLGTVKGHQFNAAQSTLQRVQFQGG